MASLVNSGAILFLVSNLLSKFIEFDGRMCVTVCKGEVDLAKIDPTIKAETKNIVICVLVLSMLLEAVYLIIGRWNYTVLLGNLLGASTGVLNFFFMCLGLQSALNKEVKDAKATAKLSQTYRNFMIIAVMVIAYLAPCFDLIPTVISIFFATAGVYSKLFTMKKDTPKATGEVSE